MDRPVNYDCLDVDVAGLQLWHRDQGSLSNDDPDAWPAQRHRIRRGNAGWVVWVDAPETSQWLADAERTHREIESGAAKFPATIGQLVLPTQQLVDRLKAIGIGWMPLANDVSAKLDELISRNDHDEK